MLLWLARNDHPSGLYKLYKRRPELKFGCYSGASEGSLLEMFYPHKFVQIAGKSACIEPGECVRVDVRFKLK